MRPIAPADVGAAGRPPSPEAVGQFLLQSKLPLLWGEILPTASCRGSLAFASRIVVDNDILDARAARGRPLTNRSVATRLAMKMPIGGSHWRDNLQEQVPICSQIHVTICDKIRPDKPHPMTRQINLL